MASLNYHRQHGRHCDAGHKHLSRSNEGQERKKGWARCKCPITASGTLGGIARTLATKQTSWEAAAKMMEPYLAADSWEPPTDPQPPTKAPVPPGAPAPPETGKKGILIETAVKAYLKEHETAKSAVNTIRKYGLLLGRVDVVAGQPRYRPGRLQQFADNIGLVNIDEFTPALVRQLRDGLGVSPLTAQKNLSVFKGFFEFCLGNEWVERNPARIKTLHNRAICQGEEHERQKEPFTDDDLERMYAGCREYGQTEIREWPKKKGGRIVTNAFGYRNYHRKWTGQDLADFITIGVYTGLRIGNLATFHIERLKPNGEVHIRTAKGGNKVCTWVPDWIAAIMRERAKRIGPLIFGEHTTSDPNVITDVWRRKLNILWEQTGPWKIHPTPHRLRHTFARILLQAGTPPIKVAELMGNTEAIVRSHYAAWVPERQAETTALLQRVFANAPRPDAPRKTKVIAIKQA